MDYQVTGIPLQDQTQTGYHLWVSEQITAMVDVGAAAETSSYFRPATAVRRFDVSDLLAVAAQGDVLQNRFKHSSCDSSLKMKSFWFRLVLLNLPH